MTNSIPNGFLPTAYSGPAWDEAREQLSRPRKTGAAAPLDGLLAGMALRDLHNRYAYILDQGDLDGLMALFTDDCVINSPQGTITGIAAIHDYYQRIFDETPHRFHLFTNAVVRLDEGFQSGRITSYYFTVLQRDGEPPRTLGGILADLIVKQEGQWKVRERSTAIDVSIDLASALPQH